MRDWVLLTGLFHTAMKYIYLVGTSTINTDFPKNHTILLSVNPKKKQTSSVDRIAELPIGYKKNLLLLYLQHPFAPHCAKINHTHPTIILDVN